MVFLPDNSLAIFVGDFGIDTMSRTIPGIGPQHPSDDYGKVVLIDPVNGASRIISIGHRNPGGIFTSTDGGLWLAENGPQGGDELNLIQDGHNYGWPLESFGTHYGMRTWPPDPTPGTHERFNPPIYAWVPSIATSSLARFQGEEFKGWEGDFVLGTLMTQSIRRLHIQRGRVIVDEPLPLGARVRDLTVDERGRVYVKVDERPAVLIVTNNTGSDERGGGVPPSLATCAGCHQLVSRDIAKHAGPSLVGVFGREIASAAGYVYSEALLAKEGVWSSDNLAQYIAHPGTWAPGTSMPTPDLTENEIVAVIEQLKTLKPD